MTILTKIKKSAFLTGKSADFFVTVYLVVGRTLSDQSQRCESKWTGVAYSDFSVFVSIVLWMEIIWIGGCNNV